MANKKNLDPSESAGNNLFAEGKYDQALASYSDAIVSDCTTLDRAVYDVCCDKLSYGRHPTLKKPLCTQIEHCAI